MFRVDDANRGNLKDTHKPAKEGAQGEYVYTARMGEVYMFVEVKTSGDLDPFTDPPGDATPPEYRFTIDTEQLYPGDEVSQHRVSALGQNTRYAHLIQTRQFRTCLYSISITGTTARLLRWERSGAIVTESFNYKSNPNILLEFVWRFSKATNEERGFDCSAHAVESVEERQKFYSAIKRHVGEQLPGLSTKEIEEEVDKHFWPGAITRLTVGAGEDARKILVSRPMFTSKGATGRSTVGYWGLDCDFDEVVFVKDVWRTDVPGVSMEGAVMEKLLEAGVRNVPAVVCHGDVLHNGEAGSLITVKLGAQGLTLRDEGHTQTTRTNEFAGKDWVKSLHPTKQEYRPIPRIHYRLVTKCAGFRLSTFKGTRELLSATYDASIGTGIDHHVKPSLNTSTL